MATTEELKQFRTELYSALPHRADATMDLLDALTGNTHARSVVELSLSAQFRRGHGSVHDAIDAFFAPQDVHREERERRALERTFRQVVGPLIPKPSEDRPYFLWAVDSLPIARPHAPTLFDRSYVHEAQAVPGRSPVTIGHEYALAVALPERGPGEPPWTPVLSARRVAWHQTPAKVAAAQIVALAEDKSMGWSGQLSVVVADSRYSVSPYLSPVEALQDVVIITRLRSDRVLYRQPPPRLPGKRGRPKRYGEAFRLGDKATHVPPDASTTLEIQRGKRALTVTVDVWYDLLLVGDDGNGRCVHTITLARTSVRDAAGERVYPRDLWLSVAGVRRRELSPQQIYEAYDRRFDEEHTHRFCRRNLLFDTFQTPETEHEESWVTLVTLAYNQLYAARSLANHLPRPWERPSTAASAPLSITPTMVQRDWPRIFALVGTPACPPQPRGKSPGRSLGDASGRRYRWPLARGQPKSA